MALAGCQGVNGAGGGVQQTLDLYVQGGKVKRLVPQAEEKSPFIPLFLRGKLGRESGFFS